MGVGDIFVSHSLYVPRPAVVSRIFRSELDISQLHDNLNNINTRFDNYLPYLKSASSEICWLHVKLLERENISGR